MSRGSHGRNRAQRSLKHRDEDEPTVEYPPSSSAVRTHAQALPRLAPSDPKANLPSGLSSNEMTEAYTAFGGPHPDVIPIAERCSKLRLLKRAPLVSESAAQVLETIGKAAKAKNVMLMGEDFRDEIKEFLSRPLQKDNEILKRLHIRTHTSKGLFGHQGVFVRPGEKLSKGTLFEYLGVLRTQEEDEVLVSQGSSIERLYEWEITHRGHTFVLMGYRTGNLTALINDPKSFPPTDSSTETRANLRAISMLVEGIPRLFYRVSHTIRANEELLIDYGGSQLLLPCVQSYNATVRLEFLRRLTSFHLGVELVDPRKPLELTEIVQVDESELRQPQEEKERGQIKWARKTMREVSPLMKKQKKDKECAETGEPEIKPSTCNSPDPSEPFEEQKPLKRASRDVPDAPPSKRRRVSSAKPKLEEAECVEAECLDAAEAPGRPDDGKSYELFGMLEKGDLVEARDPNTERWFSAKIAEVNHDTGKVTVMWEGFSHSSDTTFDSKDVSAFLRPHAGLESFVASQRHPEFSGHWAFKKERMSGKYIGPKAEFFPGEPFNRPQSTNPE